MRAYRRTIFGRPVFSFLHLCKPTFLTMQKYPCDEHAVQLDGRGTVIVIALRFFRKPIDRFGQRRTSEVVFVLLDDSFSRNLRLPPSFPDSKPYLQMIVNGPPTKPVLEMDIDRFYSLPQATSSPHMPLFRHSQTYPRATSHSPSKSGSALAPNLKLRFPRRCVITLKKISILRTTYKAQRRA